MGTTGRIGVFVPDCKDCIYGCVGVVLGVCRVICVDCVDVVSCVGCVDGDNGVWVWVCDWVEVVEGDCSNSIKSNYWDIIFGLWLYSKPFSTESWTVDVIGSK